MTLAREIKPAEIDFELLMQRDIDVARVDKQIVKYLNPDRTEGEVLARPTFFPPLLAAIIPVKGKEMQYSYPTEDCVQATQHNEPVVIRTWGGLIKLTYFVAANGGGLAMASTDAAQGGVLSVDIFPVKLEVKEAPEFGNEHGVRLVVFDGQHRLLALQKLAKSNPDLVENLVVPVCIVLSPQSTELKAAKKDPAYRSVPEVFRSLFVDVNKTAVVVGGHFNTLLSDASLGEIAARIFCEQVLVKYGKNGLALVEWNIRSKADATQIQRDYSITSIGVLELALRKALGTRGRRGLVKRILSLSAVESELYPTGVDYDYPKQVEWDKFSPSQKKVLEEQIRKYLVEDGLLKIFFEADQFKKAGDIFNSVVSEYEEAINKQAGSFNEMQTVLNEVKDYIPISHSAPELKVESKRFERMVGNKRSVGINEIIRYAIFQRAMIDAWVELINQYSNDDDVALKDVTAGFIVLLNAALVRERQVFSEKREYMQHSIFRQNTIKPTETTRAAFANLVLANLGSEKVARQVVQAIAGTADASQIEQLKKLGMDCATKFANHYKVERMSEFMRSFSTDFNLPIEEKEELTKLYDKWEKQKQQVRDKQLSKEDISPEFEKKVEDYVIKDVENSIDALKIALDYDVDILVDGPVESTTEEE